MTPTQMADQLLLRAERRLEGHGIENRNLARGIAYDTAVFIISANPHANPFNSDGGSTVEYWMDVKELLTPCPQG